MEGQTLFIYYNSDKSCFQIVKPSIRPIGQQPKENDPYFCGNYKQLVDGITNSDPKRGIKNYYSYEIK